MGVVAAEVIAAEVLPLTLLRICFLMWSRLEIVPLTGREGRAARTTLEMNSVLMTMVIDGLWQWVLSLDTLSSKVLRRPLQGGV